MRWACRNGRRSCRGVSPILATILLVAIALVLAAVLYVLVAGFAHSTGPTSIVTALGAGPASDIVGSSQTNAFCQKAHYCYSVPIFLAGHGVTLGDVALSVLTVDGTIRTVGQNYAQLAIVDSTNGVVASAKLSKNAPFEISGWQKFAHGGSAGAPLSTSETLWVQFGNTHSSPFGQGLTLQIAGTGSFSGTVTIYLP
ncbi:MAG TPA: archaellin/type IV pilin N-terminal domain-containing protein [Thermoplasmata archaeon]|nr:archaellin/type IV pilin N-terminal domain-containing protein [Thermoplasmata archaeon]